MGKGGAAPAAEPAKRITVWNKKEMRKVSGNAAPMEKNLHEYLRRHPECEVFTGQDSEMDPAAKEARLVAEKRITIWNKAERRKFSGNAAPLEKNLGEYLRKHPDCEVYSGQDKRPEEQAKWQAQQALANRPTASPSGRYNGHARSAHAHAHAHLGAPGSSAMPIQSQRASHSLLPAGVSEMRAVVESPFAVDPFSGMDSFTAAGLSMAGSSPGWTSQIMDSPQLRQGIPISHPVHGLAGSFSMDEGGFGGSLGGFSVDDGAMAMSFGTNGAGSFQLGSSLGSRGGSPHSLGGFFATNQQGDSGYCSKDSGLCGSSASEGGTASKPQPILRPAGDGEGSSLNGSYGTSPAQRYKADVRQRSHSQQGSQPGLGGVMGGSLEGFSPDLLASLEDGPFGMDMEMDA
jgi:hypothetical protein